MSATSRYRCRQSKKSLQFLPTRDGDQIGLKSGVSIGDRLVVRGAYDVQLASAAKGLPAEGHVH